MGVASGINTALGTGVEATYGTGQAPDEWVEFASEGTERQQQTLESQGRRTGQGQLRRGSRRQVTREWGGGDVAFEAPRKGVIGRWLAHIFGGSVTTNQLDSGAAYEHLFALGSQAGLSMTVQTILKDEAGSTVATKTGLGGKVTSAEFAVSVDDYLQVRASMDFRRIVTDFAAGTPAYANEELWTFKHAALLLDDVAAARVRSASIRLDNNLDTAKYYLGNAGLKDEPGPAGYRTVSGSMEAEFASLAALYEAFESNTPLTLNLTFTGEEIDAVNGHDELLDFEVPQIFLEGGTPTVSGDGPISVTVPFVGQYDGTNNGFKARLVSTDTTVDA
jgi:hypothetical protein